MTGIDTAALRALEVVRYRDRGFVLIRDYERDALCDGYDEAQRLRGEVDRYVRKVDDEAFRKGQVLARAEQAEAERDAARQALAEATATLTELAPLSIAAERDAARQALAGFVADLRALCDERERLALTQEPGEWPVTLVHVLDIRAVIDRHAPATPTTEEDR